MLNIGVKCNILFTEIAKTLSCVINNISTFIIFTTTKHKFGFASIAKIKIKIVKKVKCKDFFNK